MAPASIPQSGRYPTATEYTPSPNHWEGNDGRAAVCIHIMEGSFRESIAWMLKNGTSSHLAISKQGTVAQLVSLDDSAWANGLSFHAPDWICPHNKVVRPTWERLTAPINPNRTTISVELEGRSGDTMPAAQRMELDRALVYLAGRYPGLAPYHVGTTLIGHRHIDPIDKARCPGLGVNLEQIAASVNAQLSDGRPTEAWMRVWGARGITLDPGQVGWAIPQLYKFHAAELGACLRAEEYLVPNELSLAVFEGGLIYYLRRTGGAYLARFVQSIAVR